MNFEAMNKRKTTVFIGFTNIAGVGTRLKNGFLEIGIHADFYSFSQHPFGYTTDKFLNFSKNLFLSRIQKIYFILMMVIKYKYFIYIGSGTGLLSNRKEINFFKFFKKQTMIVYVGCDARMPEMVEKYKWNTCIYCPQEYKDFVGCDLELKRKRIREEESLFDFIVSPHECAGYIQNKYINILWPVDMARFPVRDEFKISEKIFRILHAPSNKEYKGSKYIIDVINKLKKYYDFEFVIVQNIDINTLYQEIINSDLIIDQMLAGWYGLFAIEAMALSRPVICYIREKYSEGGECPIINANPDTLFDVLLSILSAPDKLKEIGHRSRKYVEKNHSDFIVAKRLLDIFENEVNNI